MASVALLKLVFAVFLCIVVAAPHAEAAITCGVISENLAPCLGYLKTGQGPPPACCRGVRTLNDIAATVDDRQAACRCLKSAAGAISGLNLANTAALPSTCGVSIPGVVGPQTDCSKVN